MTEEAKKILINSVKILKSQGGLANRETKSVIVNIEKLVKKTRPITRIKRA